MTSGILVLDKRGGVTSAKAIAELKRKLALDRIGHAGTLDPMATGVLVCLTGRATRLAQFAASGTKVYSGTFQLGLVTSTDDIEGEVLEEHPISVSDAAVQEIVPRFIGAIRQVPPKVSAIKVDGKRAYRLARAGAEFELEAREVLVSAFDVTPSEGSRYAFRVTCSTGTYIRSLVRDIGALLECGAALTSLRREASLPFTIEMSKSIDEISAADVIPWRTLFPVDAFIALEQDELVQVRRGDLRALDRLSSVAPRASGMPELVCYGAASDGEAHGVLRWTDQGWRIELTVATD